ncbi:MFS transporter [Halobacillus litoralis]|uniref:MFS transporter n=1 Tax=Halobacillus litoralis TaxID=45668 RepID=UPI001CD66161|nr:MFS transporter [Halobacillus litoralis]MCA0970195.1 MFS transporter [Halobacillus litoralis]
MKFTSSFRYLWLGQSCANLGDILYVVALIALLFESTASAFSLALLPFCHTFGRFFGGLSGPVWMNRLSLKRVITVPQWGKTVLLFSLTVLLNAVSEAPLYLVFGFVLVIAFLDGCSGPASRAMVQRVVAKAELLQANSWLSVVTQSIQLTGWAVGGMMVALWGGLNVLWLTVTLFIISSLLMMRIKERRSDDRKWKPSFSFRMLGEGWSLIWNQKLFRKLHAVVFLDAFANVVWIAAIVYVFVAEVLHQTEAFWGYINTTFFLGLLAGGALVNVIRTKVLMKTMMVTAAIGSSGLTILFGLNSIAWIALVISALFGVMEQAKSIAIETTLQIEVDENQLPLVYSAQEALVTLTFGIGALVFGWWTDGVGVQYVFLAAGFVMAVGALVLMTIRINEQTTMKKEMSV